MLEDPQARILETRRRLRPELLAHLKGLYAADDGSDLSRAEIIGSELRLQTLDNQLARLLPLVTRARGPLGWERFRPALRRVRRAGDSAVAADVTLAFSPENHECVHGPSTLVPVATLAARLLARGETLASIERVSFLSPLRHAVRLAVWDSAQPVPWRSEGAAAFDGTLRTSRARRLDFAAWPRPQRPLTAQLDYNALSLALVSGTRFDLDPEPHCVRLPLSEEGLGTCRAAIRRRPALAAALVLDLVPIAILNWKRGRPMVACGYRDVPLPAPPAASFPPGTRLELRYRDDLSHSSARSGLWIGHYEFRYAPAQSDWSTMVMAEADDVYALLRKLHA